MAAGGLLDLVEGRGPRLLGVPVLDLPELGIAHLGAGGELHPPLAGAVQIIVQRPDRLAIHAALSIRKLWLVQNFFLTGASGDDGMAKLLEGAVEADAVLRQAMISLKMVQMLLESARLAGRDVGGIVEGLDSAIEEIDRRLVRMEVAGRA